MLLSVMVRATAASAMVFATFTSLVGQASALAATAAWLELCGLCFLVRQGAAAASKLCAMANSR